MIIGLAVHVRSCAGEKGRKNPKNTEKGRQNQSRAEEVCGPGADCRQMQNTQDTWMASASPSTKDLGEQISRSPGEEQQRGLCGDRVPARMAAALREPGLSWVLQPQQSLQAPSHQGSRSDSSSLNSCIFHLSN